MWIGGARFGLFIERFTESLTGHLIEPEVCIMSGIKIQKKKKKSRARHECEWFFSLLWVHVQAFR